MSRQTLAINGGQPVRRVPFPSYQTIGVEEKKAVAEVMESGVLSLFQGSHGPNFLGGPRVRQLEAAWQDHFHIPHAVAMNSATSVLNAAVGAIGISPGDEVIVSPYTMSASATCAVVYHATPVFADIDPDTFCLDPSSVARAITPRTKAIVVVHLFGHPADMAAIRRIAVEHNLRIIEDAAQAPGATYQGRPVGTLGDIGVFSLNYHKHIHTGEGGVGLTSNANFALRMQLIRNHAEAVVGDMGIEDISNLIGWNYRMTELEAAIGTEQLKKLESLVERRIRVAERLTARLSGAEWVTPPVRRDGCRHVYYLYAMKYNEGESGVSRSTFAAAIRAEGVPVFEGYVRPIYLEPMYQQRIAFGRSGCPFNANGADAAVSYEKGTCPVAERLYERELLFTTACHAGLSEEDVDDVARAFEKVVNNIHDLCQPAS